MGNRRSRPVRVGRRLVRQRCRDAGGAAGRFLRGRLRRSGAPGAGVRDHHAHAPGGHRRGRRGRRGRRRRGARRDGSFRARAGAHAPGLDPRGAGAGPPVGGHSRGGGFAAGLGQQVTAQDTVPFCIWCASRYRRATWSASGRRWRVREIATPIARSPGKSWRSARTSGRSSEWLAGREPLSLAE